MSVPRVILLAGDGARAPLHELLADGSVHVRVLTRNEEFAAVMKRLRADVEEGDLGDCASIRKAMRGAYGVVAAPETIEEGRNVLKVAAGSEIEELVMIANGDCGELESYASVVGAPAVFVEPARASAIASMFSRNEDSPCLATSLPFFP
ncbi:MAG TPA: NAD(P)H-binding protein [Thermoanaerobaculia bacterium]